LTPLGLRVLVAINSAEVQYEDFFIRKVSKAQRHSKFGPFGTASRIQDQAPATPLASRPHSLYIFSATLSVTIDVADLREPDQNSKSEYRNSKQARNFNVSMTKTGFEIRI